MRPPSGGEFHRIGKEIEHDLLEQPLVGAHADALGDVGGDLDPLVLGAGGNHTDRVVEEAAEPDLLHVEADAAGLDLRHVEHVVDDVEQVLAALVDVLAVAAILLVADRAEHFRRHDLGEADDGVEWRAQLVAHIGEEARFRLVGLFGAGLLLRIFLREVGKLLGLTLERALRGSQVGDDLDLPLLALHQLLFVQT